MRPTANAQPLTPSRMAPRRRSAPRSGFVCRTIVAAVHAALWTGWLAAPAHAGPKPAFGTPAWIAQQTAQPRRAGTDSGGRAPSANQPGAGSTPDQARDRMQRSIGDLSRAAAAITRAQQAQAAARQIAIGRGNPDGVRDGLGRGGLLVADGVDADPSLWQHADRPTQTTDGDQTTVTVHQTDQRAILTWENFNVGQHTTLHFDQRDGRQSDGSNEWVVLNRVQDPRARPSQILGEIKAEGSVYVINRNGIVFGGGSQVNVHSLIASSLAFRGDDVDVAASNRRFLQDGLGLTSAGTVSNVLGIGSGENASSSVNEDQFRAGGDIRVEAGARISAGRNGFAFIAAPNIDQRGTITADQGQVLLAAGHGVALTQRTLSGTGNTSTNLLDARLVGQVVAVDPATGSQTDVTPLGVVRQRGLIQVDRGDATLVGGRVEQLGVVSVTTGLSRPGSIVVRAGDQMVDADSAVRAGLVRFGAGSITAVLPIDDGTTTTSSGMADQAFRVGRVAVNGGSVLVERDALIEAPGATVTLKAVLGQTVPLLDPTNSAVAGRIYVDHDAVIDVAGLADVQIEAAATRVTIPRLGQNELANSPLQRIGLLFGQRNIVIDPTLSGVRDDGVSWVGSPLLNAQGYVDLVPRRIDQMLVNGGKITLDAAEAVITRSGSRLNLDGGYNHVLAGRVAGTTRLLAADGRTYDLANAPTDLDYVGLAGVREVSHSRWNVTERWVDPVMSGQLDTWQDAYVAGGRAGTLTLRAGTSLVEGEVSAQAVSGRRQVVTGALARGGTLSIVSLGLTPTESDNRGGGVVFRDGAVSLDRLYGSGFSATSTLASDAQLALSGEDTARVLNWTPMSTSQVRGAGFAEIDINEADASAIPATSRGVVVERGSTLQVADGGRISVYTGGDLRIDGRVVAHAGTVMLATASTVDPSTNVVVTPADIVLGSDASIDVSGRFINDRGLMLDDWQGPAHVDGGSVSIATQFGAISLARGSTIDVSGGARITADGQLAAHGGTPDGDAGSIALRTVSTVAGANGVVNTPLVGSDIDPHTRLTLDGTLRAEGFGAGGTLSLQAPSVRIGGAAADAPANMLQLDPGLFTSQGFGHYDVRGALGLSVASGTTLAPTSVQRLADVAALLGTESGATLVEGRHYRLGQLDDSRRAPVSLSLSQTLPDTDSTGAQQPDYHRAGLTVERGATIRAEAGAAVTLSGLDVVVAGQVVAHGGDVTVQGLSNTTTNTTHHVWLTDTGSIDVSGATLIDPLAASERLADGTSYTPRSGRVLDGGSITLAYTGGYVVAEAGSRLDVSGTVDRLDLPAANPGADGRTTARRSVWSDAGSISVSATSGLFLDATLLAHGGSAQAAGGRLSISPPATSPAATAIVIEQSGSHLPSGQGVRDLEGGTPSGRLYLAADRLQGSGIADLMLGRAVDGTPMSSVPIVFSGNVSLSLARSIQLNAPSYAFVDAGQVDPSIAPTGPLQVSMAAPYVLMGGYADAVTQPTAAAVAGVEWNVQATHIDVTGSFATHHVQQVRLTASEDLRFSTGVLSTGGNIGASTVGVWATAGSIDLTARQLYPQSGTAYAIVAHDPAGAATEITIHGAADSASSQAPLSAGGRLAFDASTLVQAGTVRAPAGQLVFGWTAGADQNPFGGSALTLTPTTSVTLTEGSRTSVSLEGLTVPYGRTVDGVDWRYAVSGNAGTAPLDNAPGKSLTIAGGSVALQRGAVVDVSGSGDLQASEWVPGTGGTRDVLSRYNTDYTSGSPTAVPLYADARRVYAILPGDQGRVAAYDPGASSVADGPAVGQRVWLSAIPGRLRAGWYTLLPAAYATLPGALRVVQDTGAQDTTARSNQVAADGSYWVAGRYGDTLGDTEQARTTRFLVQTREVWGQYSEYQSTSANAFFVDRSSQSGAPVATATRPADAGRLSLIATDAMQLDGTVNAAADRSAAQPGADAQIDLAAPRIQIVGHAGDAGRDGYLVLDAARLNALGAGSLLIGGVRTDQSDGTHLDGIARSLVVSNAGGTALQGPEILLATGAAAGAADTGGESGLHIEAGSVIRARGSEVAATPERYLIGRAAAGTDAGLSGDGALLRVSNGGNLIVDRRNVGSDPSTGSLQVDAGARLDGGQGLLLDASGDTALDARAVLAGHRIEANAGRINFGTGGAAGGLVIGDATLRQLSAADTVVLRSRSTMEFHGAQDLQFAGDLTLGAARFVGDGSDVRLRADTLQLDNALQGTASAGNAAPAGRLTLRGRRVLLGSEAVSTADVGNFAVEGYRNVSIVGTRSVASNGVAVANFGSAAVTLSSPVVSAQAAADVTLRTSGRLALGTRSGTADAATALGGRFAFVGRSVDVAGRFRAPSGSFSFEATRGDVTVADGAAIDASGVPQDFFDLVRYTRGGSVTLNATRGDVRVASGATIDVSGGRAAEGGAGADAGSLALTAARGQAVLGGTWRAASGSDSAGGRLTLDTGAAADLDALATRLDGAGFSQSISVRSGAGDLVLSAGRELTAQDVQLVADGEGRGPAAGQVRIDGRIDASGERGGRIGLYGRGGVSVNGTLLARGDADHAGGTIVLATSGTGNGRVDAGDGHQLVDRADAGAITLGAGAVIDTRGGTRNGRLLLRAPLLADGDTPITVATGATLRGVRSAEVEVYGVWSTDDPASAGAGRHFDGIVDPAGWYDANGRRVAGTWTDAYGNAPDADGKLPDGLGGLRDIDPDRDLFTPDAGAVNADHRDFYGTTLAGFVQNPGFTFDDRLRSALQSAAGRDVLALRPGIELRNPSSGRRGGDIEVLTPWNLAASDDSGLLYRYRGEAPVVSLRAGGDLRVRASLTDGFVQRDNTAFAARILNDAQNAYATFSALGLPESDVAAPVDVTATLDATAAGHYYALYLRYGDYLNKVDAALGGSSPAAFYLLAAAGSSPVAGTPAAPPAPTSGADYPAYVRAYAGYLRQVYALYLSTGQVPVFERLAAPPAAAFDVPVDNGVSPVRTLDNPLPLHAGSLMSGPSASWNLSAGADLASARVAAVHAGASADVSIERHIQLDFRTWSSSNVFVDAFALLPTMVRSGTGDIALSAPNDIRLDDDLMPGVVLSAGRQAPGSAFDTTVRWVEPSSSSRLQLLANGVNQPVAGGDVALIAGRDIVGRQALYTGDAQTWGVANAHYAQYWTPWTMTSNQTTDPATPQPQQTGLNFAGFAQGVLGVGSEVSVSAGRDLRELSASLPTTYSESTTADCSIERTVHGGGGVLDVRAGRDVLSGAYMVSHGQGVLEAGGAVGASLTTPSVWFTQASELNGSISTLLGLQDAQLTVTGARGVNLGGVLNPDLVINSNLSFAGTGVATRSTQAMGPDSSLEVSSLAGDVRLNSLRTPNYTYGYTSVDPAFVLGSFQGGTDDSGLLTLPAAVNATAFGGNLSVERGARLTASERGRLNLLARKDLQFYDDVAWSSTITSYLAVGRLFSTDKPIGDDPAARESVHLYAAEGDILDGRSVDGSATNFQPLQLLFDRPARIAAGRDIVNLWFQGQNNANTDVTSIAAGRDFFVPASVVSDGVGQQAPSVDVQLGGAGTLLVTAGRNLGPLIDLFAATTAQQPAASGIKTIGRSFDPSLPARGADLMVLFGVGPGTDLSGFANRYIDPSATRVAGQPSYADDLLRYMRQQAGGSTAPTTAAEAWRQWAGLSRDAQLVFVQRVFLDLLKRTGLGVNDPQSPLYGRYALGYQAIETLFPAARGYTANRLDGSGNGALTTVHTGDLDMRGSTLQTQQGGDLSILGPGGRILVGSTAAAGVVYDSLGNVAVGPNNLGLLVLKTGDLSIFVDQSVQVAQSRIFTEQGGDLLIWSSNGDINAGKGAKTTAETPVPTYTCTTDFYCRVDAGGLVTGAGIATLQTVPGGGNGDAVLVAPVGTVDAGEAGIRASGNLVVAAAAVANADNIAVQGSTVGVPTGQTDVGAIAAAGAAAAAAEQAATEQAAAARNSAQAASTVISVEIIGFGLPDEEQRRKLRERAAPPRPVAP